jgi:hypothetical protein
MWYSPDDLLALLIVATGTLVQAWVGIGFGLLAAPLLYLINPAYVPGPVLLLGWVLSLLVVIRQRCQLNWRRVLPAMLARVPGSWCGALLLLYISSWQLSLVFGTSLLLAIWLSSRRYTLKLNSFNLSISGFLSGLMGTATSVGGPPIALLYQYESRKVARNEIAAFFLVGTPVSLLMLAWGGGVAWIGWPLVIKAMPGLFLGYWLSRQLESVVDKDNIRVLILFISVLSATVVLWQGVMEGLDLNRLASLWRS